MASQWGVAGHGGAVGVDVAGAEAAHVVGAVADLLGAGALAVIGAHHALAGGGLAVRRAGEGAAVGVGVARGPGGAGVGGGSQTWRWASGQSTSALQATQVRLGDVAVGPALDPGAVEVGVAGAHGQAAVGGGRGDALAVSAHVAGLAGGGVAGHAALAAPGGAEDEEEAGEGRAGGGKAHEGSRSGPVYDRPPLGVAARSQVSSGARTSVTPL